MKVLIVLPDLLPGKEDPMEPIWLKHYPQGVPAEVDVHRFAFLKDMLAQCCARFRQRPAFTNLGVSLSYDQLDHLSRNFSALRVGLVVVNVNPLYTARELQHQLADSGAAVVVVLENFAHTLEEVVAAAHTGIPVVPITLTGTRALLPDTTLWPRYGKLQVRIGAPLSAQGEEWQAVLQLHDGTRRWILAHLGEIDATA